MSDGPKTVQAYCMVCSVPVSKDGRGNWWHTDGFSPRCNTWESAHSIEFHASGPAQEETQ